MTRIEALIFDCDGVMFESRQANLAYYNRILDEFSYPRVCVDDQEQADLCHTASSPDVLRGLLRPEDVELALDFAAELDYREFIPHMVPERHLEDVLSQISKTYPLAVATNRGRSIIPILDHFNLKDYFSVVVTSHDVARPKPAPDMLLLAAEKLEVHPNYCLFIGDSELDRCAADGASVQFAGYGKMVLSDRPLANHLELLEWMSTK